MEPTLAARLAYLAEARAHLAWQPRLFHLARDEDGAALAALVATEQVAFVHDELRQQLADLVATRNPDRRLQAAERERLVDEHLRGVAPHLYGVWAYFPWSRRLVHVLPEAEFRELRTNRNRHKITTDEQEALRRLKIGVVGLSVGQASAVTLAMEGVGGELRLADFDALDLSNLNRLRAGVHSLGVNKSIVTAREIFELDPFARVDVFTEGIHEGNVEAFLTAGGKLDLLVEECDDLHVKIAIRERARALGIPVLMETSDRGLLDVERFDRDPDRPPFHGLAGDVRAGDMKGLTTDQKVPVVLRLLDEERVSPRMAASMLDIDATLKTWPQLASAVALGGALITDAARRIALGRLTSSGRYYVDLEELVCDGRAVAAPREPAGDDAGRAPSEVRLPPLEREAQLPLTPSVVRTLVAWGTTAPSGGNAQPWRFAWRDGCLRCTRDAERSRSFLDFREGATTLAFGALAENVAIAARAMGLEAQVSPFPDPADATAICDVHFRRADPSRDPLLEQIGRRVTNRRLGTREPLEPSSLERIAAECAARGGRVHWLTSPRDLDAIAAVLGRGDRLRFLSEAMHRELMSELRWTPRQADTTRDGIDLATLEMSPADRAGLRLVSRWPLMKLIRELGTGAGLGKSARKAIAAASAVGLATYPGRGREAYFHGGRALQRAWLAATELGLAFQPMTALLYLFERLERGDGEGFSPPERLELEALRVDYARLFTVDAREQELMLFRLARCGPPSARSLRREVDDVLEALER